MAGYKNSKRSSFSICTAQAKLAHKSTVVSEEIERTSPKREKKFLPLPTLLHFLAFYAGFAIPESAAFFISSFKVPDAWNVFAPLNSHLIPLLLFISSMSSLVTYEMYSPPFGEIARRLFLENSILLRLPTQLKAAP